MILRSNFDLLDSLLMVHDTHMKNYDSLENILKLHLATRLLFFNVATIVFIQDIDKYIHFQLSVHMHLPWHACIEAFLISN